MPPKPLACDPIQALNELEHLKLIVAQSEQHGRRYNDNREAYGRFESKAESLWNEVNKLNQDQSIVRTGLLLPLINQLEVE